MRLNDRIECVRAWHDTPAEPCPQHLCPARVYVDLAKEAELLSEFEEAVRGLVTRDLDELCEASVEKLLAELDKKRAEAGLG